MAVKVGLNADVTIYCGHTPCRWKSYVTPTNCTLLIAHRNRFESTIKLHVVNEYNAGHKASSK